MDLSLIYRALAERQVDLIAGDATSGLIDAYGLTMLEDNRHYFPPYDAVPVVRSATLLRASRPCERRSRRWAGGSRSPTCGAMNHAVDADRRDPC